MYRIQHWNPHESVHTLLNFYNEDKEEDKKKFIKYIKLIKKPKTIKINCSLSLVKSKEKILLIDDEGFCLHHNLNDDFIELETSHLIEIMEFSDFLKIINFEMMKETIPILEEEEGFFWLDEDEKDKDITVFRYQDRVYIYYPSEGLCIYQKIPPYILRIKQNNQWNKYECYVPNPSLDYVHNFINNLEEMNDYYVKRNIRDYNYGNKKNFL